MSDSKGRVVITGLTAGMTITAKEVSTVSGYVLDPTPQTIEITEDDEAQTLYFYNKPEGGVEITKVNAADKTERIPNTTFEIRKTSDDALVDTVTTGRDGKVYLPMEPAITTRWKRTAPVRSGWTPPHLFYCGEWTGHPQDGNQPASVVFSSTRWTRTVRESLVSFSCFMIAIGSLFVNTPRMTGDMSILMICPSSGRFYLRELENEGYIVDDQLKTVYVQAGKVTEVEWENTPITGQIQITKTSADYNSMNGWPAGTPIPNTEFEIYNARTVAGRHHPDR